MKYNLFNLKKYGIPQDRERVIIYGIRSDLDIDFNLANIEPESPRFNRDIIEHSLERCLLIEKKEILKKIAETDYLHLSEQECKVRLEPPTNLIKCYNKGELSFKKRSKSTYGCIIDLNDVSRTILSTYSRMPRLFVPVKVSQDLCYLRPYTVLELQRIQGFPDSFVFKGNYTAQVTQIGNAIAPIFVEKIMSYILGILTGDIIEVSQLTE
jgi:DNA (cytosine-5)-methyltransferase 1